MKRAALQHNPILHHTNVGVPVFLEVPVTPPVLGSGHPPVLGSGLPYYELEKQAACKLNSKNARHGILCMTLLGFCVPPAYGSGLPCMFEYPLTASVRGAMPPFDVFE